MALIDHEPYGAHHAAGLRWLASMPSAKAGASCIPARHYLAIFTLSQTRHGRRKIVSRRVDRTAGFGGAVYAITEAGRALLADDPGQNGEAPR